MSSAEYRKAVQEDLGEAQKYREFMPDKRLEGVDIVKTKRAIKERRFRREHQDTFFLLITKEWI